MPISRSPLVIHLLAGPPIGLVTFLLLSGGWAILVVPIVLPHLGIVMIFMCYLVGLPAALASGLTAHFLRSSPLWLQVSAAAIIGGLVAGVWGEPLMGMSGSSSPAGLYVVGGLASVVCAAIVHRPGAKAAC